MFSDIPQGISLWDHQRRALSFVIERMRANSPVCLVRMPTGTGKTGVIACLSVISAPGRVLVLTPWKNLRDQMVSALQHGFWANVRYPAPNEKTIVGFVPSSIKDVLSNTDAKVLVCTFTTLTEIQRSSPQEYAALAASVDAVVVDECHYEPALRWGKAVKSLNKPMILMTATPYRNDLKLFRIENPNESVFHFSHHDAEAAKIIRPLKTLSLPDEMHVPKLAQEFSAAWKAAVQSNSLISSTPRAIICCTSAADIKAAVAVIRGAGLDAIGIHDTFTGDAGSHLLKEVPERHSAVIWIHQHKLTEGLDDHRFCCVAFFGPVGNDRKLIQQIGRVLRRGCSDREDCAALLYAPNYLNLGDRWLAYREFEKSVELLTAQHYRNVVERMLESQPSVEYFDGRFRRRFRQDVLADNPQVVIAPSVLVRRLNSSFSLKEYIEDCTDSLNLKDAIILGEPNAPCQRATDFALWVYASIANSRLLEETSLYEVRLEVHCVVVAGDYLLVSDTTGTYPEALIDMSTAALGAAELSQLLDASYSITNVSTSSAIPFDTVIRASVHRGHDLKLIPASLTDRVQICKAARGASATGRRYVGMQRGRVRQDIPEQQRRRHSVSLFKEWATSIASALASTHVDNIVLQRYMQTCKPPQKPLPVAMSIDLSQSKIRISSAEGEELRIVASSVEVTSPKSGLSGTSTNMHECTYIFEDLADPPVSVELELLLEYQQDKGRFWFKGKGVRGGLGVQVLEDDTGSSAKSFTDYLNQNQELVLIGLQDGAMVYQGRNFYKVDYAHAEESLLQHFSRPRIAACANEKGTTDELDAAKKQGTKATAFIPGSLFKVIADGDVSPGFSPELVICDDLGSECADFVLANFTNRQIALVHAKAGKGTSISASAFHDVVAQAMKNLVYLARGSETPDGAKSWTKSTFWNNTKIPRLYKAPAKCPTGIALWKKLRSDIIERADAQLHVVLVTAGCCDLEALQEVIKYPSKRTAETAQLFHLFDGLVGYARQLGVRVTVLDVPHQAL